MFQLLQDFWSAIAPGGATHSPRSSAPATDTHALQLAAAVLLVEVMRADASVHGPELEAAVAALQRKFGLPRDETERLLALARDTAHGANDFYRFTSAVNEGFSHERKVALVEQLWMLAYADGHLDENENHAISKIAGLLHVTHGEYIAAKLHAKAASGVPD